MIKERLLRNQAENHLFLNPSSNKEGSIKKGQNKEGSK